MIIPRVTTRGYYDRATGATLDARRYSTYPPGLAASLAGRAEIAVMVHGMRNDSTGAASKTRIASERLVQLGYVHPVIGYSYDSNIKGAHMQGSYTSAIKTANVIAAKNGHNLACFIEDFMSNSPDTKIRLMGHSLGSQVILSAILYLYERNYHSMLETVHLFAASAACSDIQKHKDAIGRIVRKHVTNYYWPDDDVLLEGQVSGANPDPVGLTGMIPAASKWHDVRATPESHRFVSWAPVLGSFP